MGIYLHICISRSVTKKEWEEVYEETLQLVNVFPLAERREVKFKGIETICLVPTKEREEVYGWSDEKIEVGWFASGDYETMSVAEDFELYRDMFSEEYFEKDAPDAIMGVLPTYMNYSWDDPQCDHAYHIWRNKTQGEPYHMYLLGIACLIEARLGEKAFVYGDITRGQCKKAIELVEKYAKITIDIPARCDMERFQKRVSKLPLSEIEKFEVFKTLYLGAQRAEFGEFIRNTYSKKICNEYWKNKFSDCVVGKYEFDNYFNKYLLWGFDLEMLCSLLNYYDEDNNPLYEVFIKRVMDAKLHVKQKNCEDVLEIDQEQEAPYSIYSLWAQFAFAGAKNKKIDRYIPLEEIKEILTKVLGDKCDVHSVIEQCLETEIQEIKLSGDMSKEEFEKAIEQDPSEGFQQIIDTKLQATQKKHEEYDIADCEELMYYERGDKIEPVLQENILRNFEVYSKAACEELYGYLMQKSGKRRCEWLVENNRELLIRDMDWNKIFTDIEENESSFLRYYPMVRVKLNQENLVHLTRAFVLNDEFYEFCKSNVKTHK